LVCRPFLKRDLRDEPGLKPGHILLAGWINEGRADAKKWPEHFGQCGGRRLRETRADLSDKMEVFTAICAKQNCA
jgi:hypothetical protein